MSADVLEALPDADICTGGRCRLCDGALAHTFVDLGMSPLCESFLASGELDAMEPYFPLHALVCESCFLVQLREYVSPESIFREYAYFSSYSTTWVAHAKAYCETIATRLGLGSDSLVVELASNDGYLLQHFLPLGVPVLGIEPAANVAKVAIDKGIPTRVEFFGVELAQALLAEGKQADLIVGNNVLAQVPDLNDFVAGMAFAAQAGRRDHARVPPSRAADGRKSVRHDLSRALFLFLVDHDRTHGGSARPQTRRRGGALDPRGLAPGACLPMPARRGRPR